MSAPSKPGEPRDSMDMKTSVYEPAAKVETGPIQVISMKTPADAERDTPSRPRRQVQLRAISEVTPLKHAQPQNLGYLAPPRDPAEARKRRVQDVVIWASVVVMLACGIALVIWFVAR